MIQKSVSYTEQHAQPAEKSSKAPQRKWRSTITSIIEGHTTVTENNEDEFTEKIRQLEEEEYKKQKQKADKYTSSKKKEENPLAEENLREKAWPQGQPENRRSDPSPRFRKEESRQEDPDREKMLTSWRNLKDRNNGWNPDFDPGSQKGLGWRLGIQKKIREHLLRGAGYDWVVWKIKRDTGITTATARKIVEEATEEEPEPEPVKLARKRGEEV